MLWHAGADAVEWLRIKLFSPKWEKRKIPKTRDNNLFLLNANRLCTRGHRNVQKNFYSNQLLLLCAHRHSVLGYFVEPLTILFIEFIREFEPCLNLVGCLLFDSETLKRSIRASHTCGNNGFSPFLLHDCVSHLLHGQINVQFMHWNHNVNFIYSDK